MSVIPRLNLSDFLSSDLLRKQQFVNELSVAFKEIGFISLKNHFLTEELNNLLYKKLDNTYLGL